MRPNLIEERTVEIANYIIEHKCTVREAAAKFGISKSTVHIDMIQRLPKISRSLSVKVKEILDENKAQRHIRGGIATKNKYKNKTK